MGSNPILSAIFFAPVAQRIRASDYGSEGRGFESSQALFGVSGLHGAIICTTVTAYGVCLLQGGRLRVTSRLDMSDEIWMREALELARQASKRGEVPVGAVIVRGGAVLSRSHNARESSKDATAHAEVLAIRSASRRVGDWRLTDTTLYVTLEPCPMCAGAIVLARIPRVVFAASEPKFGAAGSVFDLLQEPRLNHRVNVVKGVLSEESRALLRSFFHERR